MTGTKGKGSVSALLEAAFGRAGWQVGRYGSPHVEKVNERISVCAQLIPDADLAVALDEAYGAYLKARSAATPGATSTWFDVFTAAAYLCFSRFGVEWAIIEAGLGGRLDSTNTILPEVAVITNIGLEHTEVLGDTIEKIALEKAGILKQSVPVVTQVAVGSPAASVILQVAESRDCAVHFLDGSESSVMDGRNLATARKVFELLGARGVRNRVSSRPLSASDVPEALVNLSRLPGRLEVIDLRRAPALHDVRVILDGVHVAFALKEAMRQIHVGGLAEGQPVVLVALGRDKNAGEILNVLGEEASLIVCTSLSGDRPFWGADELAGLARSQGREAVAIADLHSAVDKCVQSVPLGGWLFVTGSFGLVGPVKTLLGDGAGKPSLAEERFEGSD